MKTIEISYIQLLTESEKLAQFRLDQMILPYELLVTSIIVIPIVIVLIIFWKRKKK